MNPFYAERREESGKIWVIMQGDIKLGINFILRRVKDSVGKENFSITSKVIRVDNFLCISGWIRSIYAFLDTQVVNQAET